MIYLSDPDTESAVVSFSTLSPLPPAPRRGRAAVCFLWHCPADHSGWALPTTVPDGARTFLGPAAAGTRLPGRLVRPQSTCAGGGLRSRRARRSPPTTELHR